MKIITLTTDFGLKDPYAGAMKGVIKAINPDATIFDITHLVSPHNILAGDLTLCQASPYYPKGSIHVAVVDPGVGSERRPIIVETTRHIFVGPDNGIFSCVMEQEGVKRVIHITNCDYFLDGVSSTFHGRDIFAPVAAHISKGVPLEKFGPEIKDPVMLETPQASVEDHIVRGKVLYVDGFGNMMTNIGKDDLHAVDGGSLEITLRGVKIEKIVKNYNEGEKDEPIALFASFDRLEIACNMGNAAEVIGAAEGDEVLVRKKGS